ncbi:hypothetical protein CABS01_05607, partial [Colletotrichum abscissum]|uniref:uncharacterized protein n=1 Tax=Colletotrichum abscissum TaxID=1671311 RepID=UPI0027D671F9
KTRDRQWLLRGLSGSHLALKTKEDRVRISRRGREMGKEKPNEMDGNNYRVCLPGGARAAFLHTATRTTQSWQYSVHSMEVLDHHLSRPFPDDGSMQPQRQNVRRKSQGPPFLHTPRCCIVVLINITFTDSNMVHRHSAGAPQPNGKGRKTDCWLLDGAWGTLPVRCEAVRRIILVASSLTPAVVFQCFLPDDSPFSWVGVAYPYLTLPWEIGGGLFLFLSVPRIRSRSGSGPLPKTNREKERKKTKKKKAVVYPPAASGRLRVAFPVLPIRAHSSAAG